MTQKMYILSGALIGWLTLWLVNLMVSYFLSSINTRVAMWSLEGIILACIEIIIAVLPYWFLRRRYPLVAKGAFIGISLTIIIILLLLPFSEL